MGLRECWYLPPTSLVTSVFFFLACIHPMDGERGRSDSESAGLPCCINRAHEWCYLCVDHRVVAFDICYCVFRNSCKSSRCGHSLDFPQRDWQESSTCSARRGRNMLRDTDLGCLFGCAFDTLVHACVEV